MNVNDYSIKKSLLETGAIKVIAKSRNRVNHILHKSTTLEFYSDEQKLEIVRQYERARNFLDLCSDDVLRVSANVIRARQKRACRVRSYIDQMFKFCNNKDICFITLTFGDDVLNNTSGETRRTYVRKFLKSINSLYIANIDYGKKTEREHYHALIPIKSDNLVLYDSKKDIYHFKNITWSYGYETVKPCRSEEDDKTRIAKYIDKFANHTIKSSTKNARVIYSDLLKDMMKNKL